jgi:hypothetical protein
VPGVVDHRRAAGAGDAAVDADLDPLSVGEEVLDLGGLRARQGDDAEDPVGVEPSDHREVIIEGLVQGPDRLVGDRRDLAGAGKRGREAARDQQASSLWGSSGLGPGHRHLARLRLHYPSLIGAGRQPLTALYPRIYA